MKTVARRFILPAVAVIVLLLASFACAVKYAEELVALKHKMYKIMDDQTMGKVTATDSDLPYRQFKGDEWFLDASLIVHACGGIDGLTYTNSKEALEQSLKKGYRYIEVDFSFSSDDKLVCVHDWETCDSDDPLDYQTFLSYKIYGKYSALDAEAVIQYMRDYPDLYIIVDTKDSFPDVVEELVRICPTEDVLNRLIIQLYAEGEKEKIIGLYSFPEENFLYTIYKTGNYPDYVASVCMKENISVITLPAEYFDGEWQKFIDKNFILYTHTVNRPDLARAEKEAGIHGVYTDFLSEADWES